MLKVSQPAVVATALRRRVWRERARHADTATERRGYNRQAYAIVTPLPTALQQRAFSSSGRMRPLG